MDNKFFKFINYEKNLAIVGSSSSILKKKYGKKIDNFNEVIRFNRSITKNFEKYVGNKTTTRVINNAVFCCSLSKNKNWKLDKNFAKKIKNKNIVVISPWRIRSEYKEKYLTKKNNYFFYESFILNKFILIYFIKYPKIFFSLFILLILKNKFMSIGIFFILLCVINKIKPKIFGFDLKEDMTRRSHYWEDIKSINPSNNHSYKEEKKILSYLKEYKLIKLY